MQVQAYEEDDKGSDTETPEIASDRVRFRHTARREPVNRIRDGIGDGQDCSENGRLPTVSEMQESDPEGTAERYHGANYHRAPQLSSPSDDLRNPPFMRLPDENDCPSDSEIAVIMRAIPSIRP